MKFSVIIPTYNMEHLLPRALESIYQQPDDDIEVIVIDDCSTDNTLDLLKNYPDIIVLKTKINSGPCAARNLGIDVASGDLFYFLDSDNELNPNAFAKIKTKISACNGNYDLFFFCCENASTGEPMAQAPLSEGIVYYQDMLCGRLQGELVPVARRRAFESGVRFEDTGAGGEGLLWLSMLKQKSGYFCGIFVQKYYVEHDDRLSKVGPRISRAESWATLTDRYLGLFGDDILQLCNKSCYTKPVAASGWYWMLSGDSNKARQRFCQCLRVGFSLESVLGLFISFGPKSLASMIFKVFNRS
jgi:GalNAc5-diNAcBac-PP-undecaprenol beta-1,3-glucosyltransferase